MGEASIKGNQSKDEGDSLGDGLVLYQVGKYEEAMECFKKVLENHPDYPQFHFFVSATLRKLGRRKEREEYLRSPKVIEGFKRLAAKSSNDGDALTKAGKQGDAREYYAVSNMYREAIKNPEILMGSSGERLEEKMLGAAISSINAEEEDLEHKQKTREEIEDVVKRAIEFMNKGVELADMGKYDEAIEYYNRALEIAPENEYDIPQISLNKAISLYNKGNKLVRSKRPNDALECFERAIAIKPDVTYGWIGKGSVLTDMGKYDEAITSFESALTIDPNLGAVWYNKGLALEKSGKTDEAVRCYEKCLSVEPNADYSASVKERLKHISKKSKKWRLFR
jgi:tetratricopeptide (TPR) repeat protein